MSTTPRLKLPLLAAEQAQKHVTHNEALTRLDAIVQLSVKSRSLAAAPGAPAEGDRYIVNAGGSGAWSGWDDKIALRADGQWWLVEPVAGWLARVDDEGVLLAFDGTGWGAFDLEESVIGKLRVGRDMVQNLLPDSGRFNGNGNNTVFNGIVYSAPTYLTAVAGASIASHAKFIRDNNDYGGTGGVLDSEVKALIDKIRPPSARRHGAEWFVIKVSQATSGALVESTTVSGAAYGLPFTTLFTALPIKFTTSYYVKVKTGSAALMFGTGRVTRAYLDGVLQPASDKVITNADGWKHVCVQGFPNQYGYDYAILNIKLPLSGELWLAMPKVVFGHVDLDPNLGVLMNGRMYG